MERTPLFVRFVVFDGEILGVFMRSTSGRHLGGHMGYPMRDCYTHMGQHSECYDGMERRKRATPEQYAELAAELRSIGYDLTIG